ncbi:hypothetical protein LOZ80_34705 [Paenibacillus sp. HWE-109]|uniref:hypothetical protein n=1 Tax=Paenibacillus sp. HWE-109 TaxID=1306526 RepID=UPI001EDFDD0D|nr:hypothetical protein [Paenibacillus sp. HWE-109]UKS26610.1 hypothetical protein LOZ80_34705 [Paenibacillus sp. HWE-109]
MKKTLIMIALVILTAGCSHSNSNESFAFEKMIIWNQIVYVVTDQQVKKIDLLLGTIDEQSKDESTLSNNKSSNYYPVGTEIYSIKGFDIKSALAVKVNNQFVKADALKK